jgi:cytosine/adenosine deaminase-related metal-dependent hydrolase
MPEPAPHEKLQTLKARWIFPADDLPIADGQVIVSVGQIVAVGAGANGPPDLDFGNAAILPGLVNAHTHLDLSGLRGKCPPSEDFTGWLRQVIRHRLAQTPAEVEADVRAGLADCLAHGTTLVGDIAAGGASWPVLAASPLRAVVFYELLGLSEYRALRTLTDAAEWVQAHLPTPDCRPGWSPHAPYSVHAFLFREAATRCASLPVAVHLAETREELQLLASHDGPFAHFLTELGAWNPAGLVSDVTEVLGSFPESSRLLLIHANYLSPGAKVPRGATVVYCPRTHAAFGHCRHPFRSFLKRGLRVVLGTDSLASNPDLDVLAEARFLRQLDPTLPDALLLRMVTIAGAEALGLEESCGSLAPGKSADLVVLSLPDEDLANPHDLIFSPAARVRAVMCRGRWLVGPEPGPGNLEALSPHS